MIYAKVIDGTIVEYNKSLPFSNATTSFGRNTSVETLKEYGYLPIVGTEPIYDNSTHRLNGISYVVTADEVQKVYDIVPITQEELLNKLFSRLRIERDTRINSVLWMRERHADELELGKGTSLTPEQYTALLTYIQALRDIPQQEGAPWDGGEEQTPWPIKPV